MKQRESLVWIVGQRPQTSHLVNSFPWRWDGAFLSPAGPEPVLTVRHVCPTDHGLWALPFPHHSALHRDQQKHQHTTFSPWILLGTEAYGVPGV